MEQSHDGPALSVFASVAPQTRIFWVEREKKYEKLAALFHKHTTYTRGMAMRIKVHYLGLVKSYTNRSQDELDLEEDASLSKLLDKLAASFGKPFNPEVYEPSKKEVKPTFVVMVNGVLMAELSGVETRLKNGDDIILMPLMTGG